jgi:uncharacterized sulfatase
VTEEGTPGNITVSQPREELKLGLGGHVAARHTSRDAEDREHGYIMLDGGTDKLVDVRNGQRAAELLAQGAQLNADGRPFFLAVGFRRPHAPHVAPREFFEAYPAATLPLPETGGPKLAKITRAMSDEDSREALRGYLACVSFMDAQLGRVLDAMDAHQLWDDTIVVFLGDHGYLLGTRGGWWGKSLYYDEAASTALLVAAPGRAQGAGCARVVEFLDLYPTLAELCGLPAPAGIEGRSFAPLLAKPDAPWPHAAYTVMAPANKPKGLAVSTGRFRYIENFDRSLELYDVQADPREWVNLAADPAHATDLAAMKKLAEDYTAKYRPQP